MQGPLPLLIAFLFFLSIQYVQPLLSYGCNNNQNLCESNEICFNDGLFGECSTGYPPPLVLQNPLDEVQSELLRLELKRLMSAGYGWQNSRTQCLLAYFKLTVAYQLQYDPNFCAVRNPANIWALLQLVKEDLATNKYVIVEADNTYGQNINDIDNSQNVISLVAEPEQQLDERKVEIVDDELNGDEDQNEIGIPLTDEEENLVNVDNSDDIVADREPDLIDLTDQQIRRLAKYVQLMESTLLDKQRESMVSVPGEAEQVVPLNMYESDGTLPLKKDIEHLGDQNTGLDKVEHKIVKGMNGEIEKVDSNRVYLKLTRDLSPDHLEQLVEYLDHAIALPNKLYFDDFRYDGDQLSFRVSKSDFIKQNQNETESSEGIAKAVYKRRKDIESLSGVRVDETGIGSGDGAVPVESERRDVLFTPIMLICAFTITVLVTVLAVHQVKQRQRNRRSTALPELAEQIEGKPSAAYQDLCRHRMSAQEAPPSGTNSKNSSTSSWSEEPISHSNMDISTGHIILNFLQEYLKNPSKIEEQWSMLCNYSNPSGVSSIAEHEQNKEKNRNLDSLPYDDTLISIQSSVSEQSASSYINASAIHDSDPRQAIYIATQSPLADTIPNFWQMIWEQGAVLIVNLANEEDLRNELCIKYWPENGSQLFGVYEIHLVSEHIWSEDYIVRSFYLKNLKTNETRTVTQFHYLTWPINGVPSTTKALLDFRRKVNKSYRGRAAPIVVHSTDGIGRTGTYCLLDVVLNRVNKGVKELNIAGSLEHLRDQRRGMVKTEEQYKMVFSCLAEEVTAMVKALPR